MPCGDLLPTDGSSLDDDDGSTECPQSDDALYPNVVGRTFNRADVPSPGPSEERLPAPFTLLPAGGSAFLGDSTGGFADPAPVEAVAPHTLLMKRKWMQKLARPIAARAGPHRSAQHRL